MFNVQVGVEGLLASMFSIRRCKGVAVCKFYPENNYLRSDVKICSRL
jgi:hypothetical protein